ncbi:transcriptional regulator with XRE-family HTH domain [Lachnospiraceae bacterium PF1-21]|uniref:Helix-turn-helix domain-containing protein n=1 Tax=Ohessyouella blattaphilus TaxID=2949333 RepID=A0ABT1EQB1_9FIRM|nr:helix-turn-helix transcriptional regulator [Ohessyouella blattaphilus]MCP1111467.1 helix-turn-helix domain-containing protein [Ohessyouella blattaphilus]MCR8564861.1 helix-turn-helix domain-containing protein [Ohessyouella blattaphilus]
MYMSGETIKHFRKKLGFTQEELAESSDLTADYISKIENSRRVAGKVAIMRIINALGISEIDILFHEHRNNVNTDIKFQIMTWLLSDCTDQELHIISDVVSVLKESLRNERKKGYGFINQEI